MSDTYLRLVPKSQFHLPSATERAATLETARQIVHEAENYEWLEYPTVHFIDCGENLEKIICPACASELTIDYFSENDPVMAWWNRVFENVSLIEEANCLDVRAEDAVTMLCCSKLVRILDLRFDWPAAFARCELSIMNPNASYPLGEHEIAKLQVSLGCEIGEVWAHY